MHLKANTLIRSFLLSFLIFIFGCDISERQTIALLSEVQLIPLPVSLEEKVGQFDIDSQTEIYIIGSYDAIGFIADYFNDIFSNAGGFKLKINNNKEVHSSKSIVFEIDTDFSQNKGYNLDISETVVYIKASEAVGLFYGIQTLRQLLPLDIDASENSNTIWPIPAVSITDYPRFGWRGLHLDVSRHFFPIDFIKKYIDHMARYKLNVFHWHLVDGAGWRMPIEAYPKLTEIGAWRADKTDLPWDWQNTEIGKPTDGRTAYGGFYSKSDIKEIIEYAQERFIEVVPEIEMPGHSYAALVSYPELACENNDIVKEGVFGKDVFCAGNEKTFAFFETVLDETMALFPSELIHIGGDEVDKSAWQNCPKCQRRMKEEGLANTDELQSYFIKRMATYVESKGREIIGWDEIMEGGLAKNAKVMSWRGMDGGIKSANMGHDVIMAPNSHTYFDLYQGNPALEPPAYSRLLLTDVYKFDPVPEDIDVAKKHHILGGHACLWTETVQTPEHAEYMLFPRLFALAETVWTPKGNLDWDDFKDRMEYNFKRLEKANINYAKSAYNVNLTGVLDQDKNVLKISADNELNRYQILYTINGSDPTSSSNLFEEPFTVDTTSLIKAATFTDTGELYSKISSKKYLKHLAVGKIPTYGYRYADQYAANGDGGLVNGLLGSNDLRDGQWQGFQKNNLDLTIDLGSAQNISKISTQFLNRPSSWIHLPEKVQYALSSNGKDFTEVASFGSKEKAAYGTISYEKVFNTMTARYVKVYGKNMGFRPNSTTQEAWLFIDEIVVE